MKKAIVIFGATGNLMYKKLIPAIDSLIQKGHIDDSDKVFCIARRDCALDDFVLNAKEHVTEQVDWKRIVSYLEYIRFDISNIADYKKLDKLIVNGGFKERMFYLAVPPTLFPIIAKGVSDSNLIHKGDDNARIVFEKPFGSDLESAKKINRELWKYFDENQIYRIDHYLGKEMIQNILIVRFANKVFSDSWNNKSIESIHINAFESEGVMARGNYYDKIGALKDMVQSHLLQMASLITMERPIEYTANNIKDEKIYVLKKLKINPEDVVLGQYDGYLKEINIKENSKTETFVHLKASIDSERWQGVPIYITTGKMLGIKRSEIIVNYKDNNTLFPTDESLNNQLIIRVAPQEGVMFRMNVKKPGLYEDIVPAQLDYCHSCQTLENTPEAYEKLLLDLINKNKTLFTRWDEIETTWEIIHSLKCKLSDPIVYKSPKELGVKI